MSVCSGVRSHRAWQTVASATLLAVLAACGGGGGGSSSTTPVQTSQPASVDARSGEKIKLGGVVSKGLLGNANVRVLAVKSDGTIDESSPLATGLTQTNGSYETTEFTITGPFVVEVQAKPCSNTTSGVDTSGSACSFHQDEAQAARQYLPSDFKIRAIVSATPADNKVNVTLFSEFAIRAALKASGGLSTANMAKAQSMVNNLFGTTDLNTVEPKTLANNLTPAEARLAALLKAASNVASNTVALRAIGCATETAGTPEATLCAVNKLSGNANTSKYVGDTPAVAAELDKALQDVVADADSAELTAVVSTTSDKLTNESLSVPTPAATDTGAYDTIKAFFADLVETARTLFDTSKGASQAATLVQAHQFEDATGLVKVKGDILIRNAQALQLGARLLSEFPHTSVVQKTTSTGVGDLGDLSPAGYGCWLVKGVDLDTSATSADLPADITGALCYADYAFKVDYSTGVWNPTTQEYSYTVTGAWHLYLIRAERDGGGNIIKFTYESMARKDTDRRVNVNWNLYYAYDPDVTGLSGSASFPQPFNDAATIPQVFFGEITGLAFGPQGQLEDMTIDGELPDAINTDATLLHASTPASANLGKQVVHTKVTVVNPSYDGAGKILSPQEATFSGTLVSYAGNGSTQDYNLALRNGHLIVENQKLKIANFDAEAKTAANRVTLSIEGQRNSLIDDSAEGSITGAFYNDPSPSAKPFIQAKLSTQVDNSSYDRTQAISSGNFQIISIGFDGFVTAPNSPKLRVALTGAVKRTEDGYRFGLNTADAISGDYFIYNSDGSLKRDVTFTFKAPDVNTSGRPRVISEIVDPTNKVAFTFGYTGLNQSGDNAKADTRAKVYVNKVERGLLDTDTGELPKVSLNNDLHEFFTLDFGKVEY